MRNHVHEATLTRVQDLRNPFDRRHAQDAVSYETECTRLLRDQEVTLGEERDGPRAQQTLSHRDDPMVVVLRPKDWGLGQSWRDDRQKKPNSDEDFYGCPDHLNSPVSLNRILTAWI
jgi:hypothetical protein